MCWEVLQLSKTRRVCRRGQRQTPVNFVFFVGSCREIAHRNELQSSLSSIWLRQQRQNFVVTSKLLLLTFEHEKTGKIGACSLRYHLQLLVGPQTTWLHFSLRWSGVADALKLGSVLVHVSWAKASPLHHEIPHRTRLCAGTSLRYRACQSLVAERRRLVFVSLYLRFWRPTQRYGLINPAGPPMASAGHSCVRFVHFCDGRRHRGVAVRDGTNDEFGDACCRDGRCVGDPNDRRGPVEVPRGR